MTLKELNDYRTLVVKLRQHEALIKRLRERAGLGAQVLTGMPHVTGAKDKVGTLAVAIADLSQEIEELRRRIDGKCLEIDAFLETVPDPILRTALRLRFQSDFQWGEVADLMGNNYTAESLKTAVYKYLQK